MEQADERALDEVEEEAALAELRWIARGGEGDATAVLEKLGYERIQGDGWMSWHRTG